MVHKSDIVDSSGIEVSITADSHYAGTVTVTFSPVAPPQYEEHSSADTSIMKVVDMVATIPRLEANLSDILLETDTPSPSHLPTQYPLRHHPLSLFNNERLTWTKKRKPIGNQSLDLPEKKPHHDSRGGQITSSSTHPDSPTQHSSSSPSSEFDKCDPDNDKFAGLYHSEAEL